VFFIPDDRNNLTAYIGVLEPVSVFCNFALPITITLMELQGLLKPNRELGWHTKGGDLPIYIYDLTTVDFCGGALTHDRIIATGSVRLSFVDRDFELPDPNVEPSYGYSATGTVTYVNGGTAGQRLSPLEDDGHTGCARALTPAPEPSPLVPPAEVPPLGRDLQVQSV
jgi:hypothetical protein